MIQYRIIESAPLPEKAAKERKTREKRDFSVIPVGGAAAYPVGDADPKKLKQSIYQSANVYRKANPDFQFKVSIEKNEETGAAEIWVRRLATETAALAAQSNTETISNGDYDYSSVAAE
jgi:hypothetical protein